MQVVKIIALSVKGRRPAMEVVFLTFWAAEIISEVFTHITLYRPDPNGVRR